MSAPPPAYSQSSSNQDTRPLPEGWISQYDPNYKTWFYVNTKDNPPSSQWVHPADSRPAATPQQYAPPTGLPPVQQQGYNAGQQPYSGGQPPAQQTYNQPPAQHAYAGGQSSTQQPFAGGQRPVQQPYGSQPPQQPYGVQPYGGQPYGAAQPPYQPTYGAAGAYYGGGPAPPPAQGGYQDQRFPGFSGGGQVPYQPAPVIVESAKPKRSGLGGLGMGAVGLGGGLLGGVLLGQALDGGHGFGGDDGGGYDGGGDYGGGDYGGD